jgi:oligopeptide transport system substrate-binding protein
MGFPRQGAEWSGWFLSCGSRAQLSLAWYRVLVLFFGLALSSCGKRLERADLVFINGAEPELLDPALITAQATSRVAYALFEGLVIFDQDAKVRPGVAMNWEVSPDGLCYTFRLRSDACWSNGEPVTSADFIYAWRRALLPETGSEYASQFYPIANAESFNTGKINDFAQVGVVAPDAHTLRVTLAHPTPYFLDLCAFSTFLPVHRATAEAHSDWASKPDHFMGNGPYLLKEWRLFDRVRLVKNPRFWNASEVALQSIDVLPATRPNTAFNLYATGAADLLLDKGLAPTPLLGELRKRHDFHSDPFLATYFIRFNAKRVPFNDSRVRRAISLVLNRRELVEKITRGGEPPAESFVPPGTGGDYVPPVGSGRDPVAARRLFAEAGFPGGEGFPVVRYLYKGDSDLDRDIAVEIQGVLQRELGIQMLLQPQEWTVYLALQGALDYDLCRSSWVADYNDPNTFLNMFVTGDGNNRTGWGNATYDSLIAAAAAEPDPARRFRHFQDAERMLVTEEAVVCPLYFYVGIQFYDGARLGGLSPNLLDEHPLRFLHWKRP